MHTLKNPPARVQGMALACDPSHQEVNAGRSCIGTGLYSEVLAQDKTGQDRRKREQKQNKTKQKPSKSRVLIG